VAPKKGHKGEKSQAPTLKCQTSSVRESAKKVKRTCRIDKTERGGRIYDRNTLSYFGADILAPIHIQYQATTPQKRRGGGELSQIAGDQNREKENASHGREKIPPAKRDALGAIHRGSGSFITAGELLLSASENSCVYVVEE